MTPDEILARPAKILSDKQRRDYFDKGYVMAASVIPAAWVERLLTRHCRLCREEQERD